MIEASVAAGIALFTAIVSVHNHLHSKISEVDGRVDKVELRVAENYVQKQELSTALQKMEDHMIRIENKLDQIVLRNG
jgi:septal ring factor EnvC (AmiA/AmiB activator)